MCLKTLCSEAGYIARVLIAGTGSGCGKTTVTIALLKALKARGLSVCSFKCGPDYIDPLFHKRVLNMPSYNLDPFFLSPSSLRALLAEGSNGASISVIEGVMGYYDGIANTPEGSTYSVASAVKAPVVLVVSCEGIANSVGAILRGYKGYVQDSCIAGVIFNNSSKAMYPYMADIARQEGLLPLGFLPQNKSLTIGSRHLGLITAGELIDWDEKLELLRALAEETLDIDGIIDLAHKAEALPAYTPEVETPADVKIAVSRDEAFCFMYDENISLLKKLGCDIAYFSPLRDKKLPENIGALWLCGGYPELYAEKLSLNKPMLEDIKRSIEAGLPTIAECGGFMYLHEQLTDSSGTTHKMASVIKADTYPTGQLKRFGYMTLTAQRDNLLCKKGDSLRVHEFHYWDSTDCGDRFIAAKSSSDFWSCSHATDSLYAGFPHIYFPAAPDMAKRFADRARQYLRQDIKEYKN